MTIQDLNKDQLIQIARLALGLPKDIPLEYQDSRFEKGIWENGKQLTCSLRRAWFETPAVDDTYWSHMRLWVMVINDNLDVNIEYPVDESLYTHFIYGQKKIQELFKEWGLT